MCLSPVLGSFFVVVSLVIAAPVLAVDMNALKDTTPEERAEAQTLMMKENLGLSGDKLEKVRAINLKYAKVMDPEIQSDDGPMKKGNVASNRQAQKDGELKAVLSPEEYEKYLASKLKMRDQIVQRIFEERAKRGQ